jgi:hypothetical protein
MSKHITIGLFEASKTLRQTLAKKLQIFLEQYGLTKTILACVKDEGVNLNTMITTLKSIVSHEIFGVMESCKGTCFGYAFFKACQYEIVEEKVSKGLKYVSIKFGQVDLQKCITQPKNSRKGKHEWVELALV